MNGSLLLADGPALLFDGPAMDPKSRSAISRDSTGEYPFHCCGGRASDPVRPLPAAPATAIPPAAMAVSPIRPSLSAPGLSGDKARPISPPLPLGPDIGGEFMGGS